MRRAHCEFFVFLTYLLIAPGVQAWHHLAYAAREVCHLVPLGCHTGLLFRNLPKLTTLFYYMHVFTAFCFGFKSDTNCIWRYEDER